MAARVALAGLLLPVALLAACSDESPPGDDVPSLVTQLEAVEEAVGSGDHDKARAALERLVTGASRAELAGDITAEEADRIREAAREVLAELSADR